MCMHVHAVLGAYSYPPWQYNINNGVFGQADFTTYASTESVVSAWAPQVPSTPF